MLNGPSLARASLSSTTVMVILVKGSFRILHCRSSCQGAGAGVEVGPVGRCSTENVSTTLVPYSVCVHGSWLKAVKRALEYYRRWVPFDGRRVIHIDDMDGEPGRLALLGCINAVITMLVYREPSTSSLVGVPVSAPVAASNIAHGGLLAMTNVAVSPGLLASVSVGVKA